MRRNQRRRCRSHEPSLQKKHPAWTYSSTEMPCQGRSETARDEHGVVGGKEEPLRGWSTGTAHGMKSVRIRT